MGQCHINLVMLSALFTSVECFLYINFLKEDGIINRNDKKSDILINEEIRFKEIRVISNTGEQLGLMSSRDALAEAYGQNLDLVMVSPNAQPPVCKIMDYKKFKFEQEKKQRLAKKNQVVVEVKELRLSPTIDKGDFETKKKACIKFLSRGDKVKLSIQFKGRMITHKELGFTVLNNMAEELKEYGNVTQEPKMEGRNLFLMIEPIKK